MTEQSAKLTWGEKTVDLPVKVGTIGPSVLDIGALYKNTASFTYDPGFTSTASCESKITYITTRPISRIRISAWSQAYA
jgi:citrate synthase